MWRIRLKGEKNDQIMVINSSVSYQANVGLPGYPRHSSSTDVAIFFSDIISYFCRLVAARNPCQGKEPRLKYIKT